MMNMNAAGKNDRRYLERNYLVCSGLSSVEKKTLSRGNFIYPVVRVMH